MPRLHAQTWFFDTMKGNGRVEIIITQTKSAKSVMNDLLNNVNKVHINTEVLCQDKQLLYLLVEKIFQPHTNIENL
jgi:hypothetical protein